MDTSRPATTAVELRCVRCAYRLTGIDLAGVCPECGLSIERSQALGKKLVDSRPGWIGTLCVGSVLLMWAQLSLMLQMASMGARPPDRRWLALACFAFTGLNCLGSWILTRRENPYAMTRPDFALVWSLRVCSLAPPIAAAIIFMNLQGDLWDVLLPPALFILCIPLQFVLLRRLAIRVLSRRLREYSAIVGIGYPLSLAAVFSASFWARGWDPPVIVLLIIFVSLFLFWLWSIFAFGYFAIAFWRASREARRNWRLADAST